MSIRFYNAGDKIEEMMRYSVGPADKDANLFAYWPLVAPKEDFFEVPTEVTLAAGETIAVQFAQDITRRFGSRGVIRIRPDYKRDSEDPEKELAAYPFAASDAQAAARGEELWRLHLQKVVQAHLDDCESARAAGGAPRLAAGFTKRALKLLGIEDPGQQYFGSLSKGAPRTADPAIAELRAQNQLMTALLFQLLQGKTIDPEMLAKLQAPAAAESGPIVSGVMTGEVKKPVSMPEAAPAKGKAARSKEATDYLSQE